MAGNCHTERDPQTGVLLHRYGPHIFHTDNAQIWSYVNRFGTFRPYAHRVWTEVGGQVFPMPVTLATINQFYGRALSPDEARTFIKSVIAPICDPKNLEEQALSMIGRGLYEAFFEGYTTKQWGCPPRDLPASILKRLPLRFCYKDSYFNHQFQGMPEEGYTPVVQAILDHPQITVHLSTPLPAGSHIDGHLFWSGPLDAYFGYSKGRLGYRTLDFHHERLTGDFQGCPVMNFGDVTTPQTRITEHKHFAPWETHDQTLITREVPRDCEPDDIPYYPIRLAREKAMLGTYIEAAQALSGVTFIGRLGTYRYLDMDVCISEALEVAQAFLASQNIGAPMPSFVHAPA